MKRFYMFIPQIRSALELLHQYDNVTLDIAENLQSAFKFGDSKNAEILFGYVIMPGMLIINPHEFEGCNLNRLSCILTLLCYRGVLQ